MFMLLVPAGNASADVSQLVTKPPPAAPPCAFQLCSCGKLRHTGRCMGLACGEGSQHGWANIVAASAGCGPHSRLHACARPVGQHAWAAPMGPGGEVRFDSRPTDQGRELYCNCARNLLQHARAPQATTLVPVLVSTWPPPEHASWHVSWRCVHSTAAGSHKGRRAASSHAASTRESQKKRGHNRGQTVATRCAAHIQGGCIHIAGAAEAMAVLMGATGPRWVQVPAAWRAPVEHALACRIGLPKPVTAHHWRSNQRGGGQCGGAG